MADLHGAGLRIRDTLQLVPLPELLSRGIGTAATAAVAIASLAGFAWGYSELQAAPRDSKREVALAALLDLAVVTAIALAVLVVPVIVGAAIVVGTVVIVGLSYSGFTTVRQDIVIALMPVVIGLALHAYLEPSPLPKVSVSTGSVSLQGDLVTASDSRWYIASGTDVTAVPEDKVDSAVIVSQRQPRLHKSVASAFHIAWWLALLAVVVLATPLCFKDLRDFFRMLRGQPSGQASKFGHEP
jgi:hypothetical protein